MGKAGGTTRERERDNVHSALPSFGGKMDGFRRRLSRRPGSLEEDVRALGSAAEEPPAPPPLPRLPYKVGAAWRLQRRRGRRRRSSSEVPLLRSLHRGESALCAPPRRALQGLPAGTMRGRELPLVLLALVLCQAPRGPAAPVPAAGDTVLAKMYPRGNHWAVGECPARASPRWDQPASGRGLPSSQRFGRQASGAGFAPTFLPKRHARSPKTPLHPSRS